MPDCQWRDKPGSAPNCKTLVNAGEEYCPRHKFLQGQREAEGLEKERIARVKREVHTVKPETRRQMIEIGLQYIGNDVCACGRPIEWWRTLNQRDAPYEPMLEVTSKAVSHFAYCKRAFEKKWKRRAA